MCLLWISTRVHGRMGLIQQWVLRLETIDSMVELVGIERTTSSCEG